MKLNRFSNKNWNKGAGFLKILLWNIVSIIFFENSLFIFYKPKVILLRIFGSDIGKNVIIKPNVKIKFPWKLKIDDYSWIGEKVWIDNLDDISIGKNVCISQGVYLLTGNHDYNSLTFDLKTGKITIRDCAWIAAKSIILPNTVISENSIIGVGCVFGGKKLKNEIYQLEKLNVKRIRKINE